MGVESIRVRMMEDQPKCPILIYNLRASGRHAPFFKPCGYWGCKSCGNSKLEQMALHIADKTRANEYLFQMDVPVLLADAVRRSLQRAKLSSLRIRFNNGDLFFVSEGEVGGRDWSIEKLPRIDVLGNIRSRPDPSLVNRHDYSLHWKPEQVVREKNGDPVIFSCVSGSMANLRQKLTRAGLDLESEFVRNPMDAAERLGASNR